MDNKKRVLVILLAFFLALATVLLFNKKAPTSEIKNVEEKVGTPVIEENTSIEQESVVEEEKSSNEVIQKVSTTKPAPKPKTSVSATPLIKPLKVEEEKAVVEEPIIDAGIMKEAESNSIVITREFKSQSPAKYSFEGYGVQKAPIK